jgi:hypothetical protein
LKKKIQVDENLNLTDFGPEVSFTGIPDIRVKGGARFWEDDRIAPDLALVEGVQVLVVRREKCTTVVGIREHQRDNAREMVRTGELPQVGVVERL